MTTDRPQAIPDELEGVAILAGNGRLPTEAAARLCQLGAPPVVIAVGPDVDPELARHARTYHRVAIGQWGEVRRLLLEGGVRRVALLGKVPKTNLYHAALDQAMKELLAGLPALNDDAIMLALVEDLLRLGFEIPTQAWALPHLLMPEGQLTKTGPSAEEWRDIGIGFQVARAIGRLDLGQTVVVKHRAVLAVEAIEGTDPCILRGGALGGPGAVVVKVRKPSQDARFDLPTMGLDTVAVAKQAGIRVLALEAGETILVDREAVVREAERAGICLIGVREEQAKRWGVWPG
mgnify:CR=1 FL=1